MCVKRKFYCIPFCIVWLIIKSQNLSDNAVCKGLRLMFNIIFTMDSNEDGAFVNM